VACCVIPVVLVAAGLLGGAAAAGLGQVLFGVAIALMAAAGLVWWATRRRARQGCSGGSCGCGSHNESGEHASSTGLSSPS
jgi:hypothetical protein